MSDETDRKALRRGLPDAGGYEVGYSKPPKETRFRPGVSGAPGGRPKGSKNKRPALHEERLKEILLDEAYRTIDVRDVDRTVTVPMAQAVVRSLAVNAAKGRARAQELFTALLAAVERTNRRQHDEWLQTAIEYKVEWDRELERRRRMGIEGPEPLPHPDDVVIDLQEGRVRIKGPMTPEEKADPAPEKWTGSGRHSLHVGR
ncbi:MAG: DUF5681 domain-containing protein [Pseudomonadota bacterium]